MEPARSIGIALFFSSMGLKVSIAQNLLRTTRTMECMQRLCLTISARSCDGYEHSMILSCWQFVWFCPEAFERASF